MTLIPHTPDMGRDVVDGWAVQIAETARLADYIANTEFVPAAYRGQPAAVAAAILAGREIGLGPMAALQHMHVIKGRPALSAQMMRALVLAAGHSLRVAELNSARCVLVGARRGGTEQSVTWSMDDARRAGLQSPTWTAYPRQMLLARATSELCRALFPDVLGGMAYTPEEAEDLDAPPPPPAVEPPTRTVRRARKQAAPKTPEAGAVQAPPTPPGPDVPEGAPTPPRGSGQRDPRAAAPRDTTSPAPANGEETGAGEMPDAATVAIGGDGLLSPEQRAAIMATLTEWGRLAPRSLRLRTLSGLIGRELVSASQLTRTEASQVLDILTNLRTMPNPDEALSVLVTAGWEHIDGGQAVLPIE